MQHKALIAATYTEMAAPIRPAWIVPVLVRVLWLVSKHRSHEGFPPSLTTDKKRQMDGKRTTCFPAHWIHGVAARRPIDQTAAATTPCCSTLIRPPTLDASSIM